MTRENNCRQLDVINMKLFEKRKLLKKISLFLLVRTLFSACFTLNLTELNMEIDFLD